MMLEVDNSDCTSTGFIDVENDDTLGASFFPMTRTYASTTDVYDEICEILNSIEFEKEVYLFNHYNFLDFYTALELIYFQKRNNMQHVQNDHKLIPERNIRYPPD